MSRTVSRIQPEAVADVLGTVLAEELGAPVRLRRVRRLKGGYSREMWSFEAVMTDEPPRPMVLCADAGNGVIDAAHALTRPQEFRLLRAAAAAGVAVPGVVCAAEAGNP